MDGFSTMAASEPALDVFWRPGCGYCTSLRVALAEAGITARWHDIWADPDSAAFVRGVAGGNETVPTVVVADRVLVAPRPRQLIEELRTSRPDLEIDRRQWPPMRIAQWTGVPLVLVAAEMLARGGFVFASWLAYAVVAALYLGLRRARAETRGPRRRR